MRKIVILLIAALSIAASIQMESNPETHQPASLKIICPNDGHIFYKCSVEELFIAGPDDYDSLCQPLNGAPRLSRTYMFANNHFVICPICNQGAFRLNDNDGTQCFTTKGWMPQRRRP